ncbi:MAG: AbrB/MazE/SpoVT family DNA-binding domain-containing protein [Candidatus Altiarchaeales archaeon]|nr:AbrB/MazE/SpoVT family DNA-binding domain-containing protein [Candidatus Altiarchaeales archaeon]
MYPNIDVEPSKMSTRGQIVIPREIREKLGLKRDSLFMVGALDKETIILKKMDKARIAAGFMKLRQEVLSRTGGFSGEEIEAEVNAVRKKR